LKNIVKNKLREQYNDIDNFNLPMADNIKDVKLSVNDKLGDKLNFNSNSINLKSIKVSNYIYKNKDILFILDDVNVTTTIGSCC
jgi:hypothetical protein